MTGLILGAILAIVVAYLYATAEAALGHVSGVRVAELREQGRAGSAALSTVIGDTAGYLSVIAFVRVVGEAVAAVLVTVAVVESVDGRLRSLAVAVGAMVLVSFVLVGVSPRTLGRQHSDRVALVAAPFVVWTRRLLGPLARLLVLFGNAVTPGKGYRDGPFRSEAELRGLVDMARDSALIEATERAMIHSVFELGDTLAREVMVPRPDMVTISVDKTLRQATSLFLRSGFSRIPVIGDDSDDVQGLLYFKDVARRTSADPQSLTRSVQDVMRPMEFVPDSKPVDDLLREMQREQKHLAVVVDEYGGTAGLVTIEDIIEEIVGEIADEYDRETPDLEDLGDGRWRVSAGMDIDDLAEHFGVSIEEDQVDTVGGLISKTIGRVPIVGSTCRVAGLELTAERLQGRRHRVATVMVMRVEPEGADRVLEAVDGSEGVPPPAVGEPVASPGSAESA